MALIPWQATVQDDNGNAITSPIITVRNHVDDTLADIFDIDGVAASNPITGDLTGFVQFQVNSGQRYTIEGTDGSQFTAVWEFEAIENVAFGATGRLVAAVGAIGTEGQVLAVNSAGDDVEFVDQSGGSSFDTVADASADTPSTDPEYYLVAYYDDDYIIGSGAQYRKVASEPVHAGKFQNGNGTWYELDAADVRPEMFGAKADDTNDDTTAINNAFTFLGLRGGGTVYFRSSVYKITDVINVSYDNCRWEGASKFGTVIHQYTLDEKIFYVTGSLGCSGETFSTLYAGTPTNGATALHVESTYFYANDFMIRNSYIGVVDTGIAVGTQFTNFEILDYVSIGFLANSVNDVFISNFIINAGNVTRGELGGIRLADKVEAFVAHSGDILLGRYSMTTEATTYAMGLRPAYNSFTDVYFDSSEDGVLIEKMIETEFTGCWFSGGREGATNGLTLTGQNNSLTFTSCRFFNNGSNGIYASNLTARLKLIGCKFQSNSQTAGSGVGHGVYFDGTVGFKVIGCSTGNDLFGGSQGYGVYVGASCSGFSIRDCDLTGNVTGPLSDNSGAVEKYISGNQGYKTQNKGAETILVGQSVAVVTHGLSATPTANDISVTFTSAPQSSSVQAAYITSIGATTFQIVSNAVVAGSNLSVSWQARVSGA